MAETGPVWDGKDYPDPAGTRANRRTGNRTGPQWESYTLPPGATAVQNVFDGEYGKGWRGGNGIATYPTRGGVTPFEVRLLPVLSRDGRPLVVRATLTKERLSNGYTTRLVLRIEGLEETAVIEDTGAPGFYRFRGFGHVPHIGGKITKGESYRGQSRAVLAAVEHVVERGMLR